MIPLEVELGSTYHDATATAHHHVSISLNLFSNTNYGWIHTPWAVFTTVAYLI